MIARKFLRINQKTDVGFSLMNQRILIFIEKRFKIRHEQVAQWQTRTA